MVSILFVCLGNICRSPAGEGILRHLANKDPATKDLTISSCGIGSWHLGQLPDIRMQTAAKRRGIILTSLAKLFQPPYFEDFDYILAADHDVLNALYRMALTPQHKAKLHLITTFSPSYKGQEVPDPYYQNDGSFEDVLDMLEDACEGLLAHIKKTHNLHNNF